LGNQRCRRAGLGLVDKPSGRCFVGNRPPEVHLDIDDLTTAKGQNLGVAEPPAVYRTCLIRHEHTITIRHEMDEIKHLQPFTVRPAALEIGPSVEVIIERAREMEVIGDQRFERCAILGDVRRIAGAC